jgi:hypothetical protein
LKVPSFSKIRSRKLATSHFDLWKVKTFRALEQAVIIMKYTVKY